MLGVFCLLCLIVGFVNVCCCNGCVFAVVLVVYGLICCFAPACFVCLVGGVLRVSLLGCRLCVCVLFFDCVYAGVACVFWLPGSMRVGLLCVAGCLVACVCRCCLCVFWFAGCMSDGVLLACLCCISGSVPGGCVCACFGSLVPWLQACWLLVCVFCCWFAAPQVLIECVFGSLIS